MATPLKRRAVLDELQVGFAAGRIELDGAGIVDRATQGYHGPIADRHRSGVVEHRRLIENEVILRQRRRMNSLQLDRLSVSQSDHRIAVGVIRQVRLDIREARKTGVADQVKLILRNIEAVNRVVTDRLRENK